MLETGRTKHFNFWDNAKETGLDILGIVGLMWVILVHGVFVFLPSLLITGPYLFSLNQNAVAVAWYLFLMSLASSTLPPITVFLFPREPMNLDEPIIGYLFGGYAGGIVGSVIAVVLKIWLEQPARAIQLSPIEWSSLIAAFAIGIGTICMLLAMVWHMMTRSKS